VLFSLIGWIVALIQDIPKGAPGAPKVHATFQAIILMALGALIVLHALMLSGQTSKGSCMLGIFVVVLASMIGLGEELARLGGLNFYIIFGGLVAILGANWDACGCKIGGKAETPAAPPEAKL
jgi:hypothetical protein